MNMSYVKNEQCLEGQFIQIYEQHICISYIPMYPYEYTYLKLSPDVAFLITTFLALLKLLFQYTTNSAITLLKYFIQLMKILNNRGETSI